MTQDAENIDLDEFWEVLQPKASNARPQTKPFVPPPQPQEVSSQHIVQEWVTNLEDQNGSVLLAIEGSTPMCRAEAYRWVYDQRLGWTAGDSGNLDTSWVQEGFAHALTNRLAFASKDGSWQLFHALIDVENFVVQDPLYSLVDRGFGLLTEFFQAIWEVRNLIQEGRESDGAKLAQALTQWMVAKPLTPDERDLLGRAHITRELVSMQDRLDILFFLLALAQQNGLIDRTVVVFDSFEVAIRQETKKRRDLLRELLDIVAATNRWARLGARTGIVLGFTKAHGTMDSLKRYNPKLHKIVKKALLQPVYL